jgi:hypothetical protein
LQSATVPGHSRHWHLRDRTIRHSAAAALLPQIERAGS